VIPRMRRSILSGSGWPSPSIWRDPNAVSTFADESASKRAAAQVIGLGLQARSTISLIGHGGANARRLGGGYRDLGGVPAFITVPSGEISAYVLNIRRRPPGLDVERLSPAAYLYDDAAVGEPSDSTFPHAAPRLACRSCRSGTDRRRATASARARAVESLSRAGAVWFVAVSWRPHCRTAGRAATGSRRAGTARRQSAN
jgi:hypothetical protein